MGEFISQELANSVGNSVNLDTNSHSNQWEVGGSLVGGRDPRCGPLPNFIFVMKPF